MMKKRLIELLSFLLIVIFVFAGCSKKKDVKLSPDDLGSDKEIYEKAKKKIKRDPEKARVLFKEVMHLYPDSIYAMRAKIGIADSYFKQKDSGSSIMAASEYQEYVNLYPNSPDAVYAKYQIARCYLRQMRKPGRDQTNTLQAIKALENMIKQFPDTNEAKKAKMELSKARQFLATHYFKIGLTNFKLRAYKGAIDRFKQVIDDYPDFKVNDKLFFYTGKSYYEMRMYDSAISFFQKIVNSFPKSKFLKKSSQLIEEINRIQTTQKSKPKTKPVEGDKEKK